MRKFVVTTALALVLAGSAYAQGHHGGGGGGGGGSAAHGGGGGGGGFGHGGGGPGPGFSAQRGPSGPSMGNHGPTGNVYNRAPAMNTHENNGGNRSRFTERNHREMYNRYEGENRTNRDGNRLANREGNRFANREGNRSENREGGRNLDHRGIVRGNFFEHGRHFGFRRFWNGQWVFLTAWDDCTAWVWLHVAPGVWAWRPVDICIG